MDQVKQDHSGPGDNIAGDKHVHYYSSATPSRLKYLNAFAPYNLANLVGRERQLKVIDEHLGMHNLLLLYGIGGIGKTTLAKAYISQNRDKYDHVAYVEIVSSIADSMLIQLGNSPDVNLKFDPQVDLEEKFRLLIDILRHIPRLLLVLDNANDADDLELRKKQLASLNSKVLVTGRARPYSFVHEHNIQEVQALTPDEALHLFRNHYLGHLSNSEHQQLKQILAETFYHPKLIEVIAKAVYANAFLNLEDLVQIVVKGHYDDDEINYPIEIDDQTKKIYSILLDLYDTETLTEEAQQLLRYFAILPTVDIPVQDLATLLSKSIIERQTLMINLSSLTRMGWLENLNNRFFSMHGLLQWVMRQRLLPTVSNCKPIIMGMADILHCDPTESRLDKQKYVPYTAEWSILFSNDQDEILSRLYNNLAIIYGALGNHQQRLVYNQKALTLREAILSSTHPDLAQSYSNLAETYGDLGNHRQRLVYNQKALTIREAILTPMHPDLAQSYNNIAVTYGELGDYEKLLIYNQKALTIRISALPPTHPDLALSYNNLAATYGELGDQQLALYYHQKALAIREAVLPATHPDLALSYNNLAVTYGQLGDYQQLFFYHQKALTIREAILPPTHPDLALSYNNLAATYGELGDQQSALYYHQKALAIREAVLFPSHPDLAVSYNNTAITYENLGDYKQALYYHQKALTIREAIFPATHPELIKSRSCVTAVLETFKSL